MQRLDEIEVQMNAAPDKQISLTDPDARSMGATHFLTKTLECVSIEMSLHVLAYNLKRTMKARLHKLRSHQLDTAA